MRLKEAVEDGVDIFRLAGEIDLHYAPVLRSLLQGKLRHRCDALVIDLTDVSFIDSAGLAAIIEYFRDSSERGGVLCLAGLNETLDAIFEIVRLKGVIPMFGTSAEAVAAVREGSVQPAAASLFARSAA